MTLLECCLSNVSSETRVALDESPYRVRESICLDRCGTCYDGAFLLVDGALEVGESHRSLLESVESGATEGEG